MEALVACSSGAAGRATSGYHSFSIGENYAFRTRMSSEFAMVGVECGFDSEYDRFAGARYVVAQRRE